MSFHTRLTRGQCIAFDITDPTPWEKGNAAVRCPVCRKMIEETDAVMCVDSGTKEVIVHDRCSERRGLAVSEIVEILGMRVSYCSLGELGV